MKNHPKYKPQEVAKDLGIDDKLYKTEVEKIKPGMKFADQKLLWLRQKEMIRFGDTKADFIEMYGRAASDNDVDDLRAFLEGAINDANGPQAEFIKRIGI